MGYLHVILKPSYLTYHDLATHEYERVDDPDLKLIDVSITQKKKQGDRKTQIPECQAFHDDLTQRCFVYHLVKTDCEPALYFMHSIGTPPITVR